MAKTKKEKEPAKVVSSADKDILKEYGDVLHDPSSIVDRPLEIISIGPKLDIALGGGVPEGSLFIMTGPEKVGKTVTALTFCANAQKNHDRKVYYANIEGRLKKRDLTGISGLDLSPEEMQIISSTEGNILSAEKYLSIIDNIVHTKPGAVAVVDSFSALSSEAELTGIWKEMELTDLLLDFGLVSKSGSWVNLPNGEKVQGKVKLAAYLEDNPDEYKKFEQEVFEMVGIDNGNKV